MKFSYYYIIFYLIAVLSPPVGSVAPLNVNVSFRCTVNSGVTIIWSINQTQISVDSQVVLFASRFLYVPLPTNDHSEMIITARKFNNNTMVKCVAADLNAVPIRSQISDTVTLKVYSE